MSRYVVQTNLGPRTIEPTIVFDTVKQKEIASFPTTLDLATRQKLAGLIAVALNRSPVKEYKYHTHGHISMPFLMSVTAESEEEAMKKTHDYLKAVELDYGKGVKACICPNISTIDISDVTKDDE